MIIKEVIKEFLSQVSVVDIVICVGGSFVLAVWLLRTRLGARSLDNCPQRRNDIQPYLALIPLFLWIFTTWLLDLLKGKMAPGLSGWRNAFAENLIMCLGAAPMVVTALVLARNHFARRLKGFGLNPKTIFRDLGAALLNLLAIMPVVLAVIILVTLVGELFVGPEYQMPRHQELKEIIEYPQLQVRILIIINAIIIVPLAEETLFRGMFQTLLRSYLSRPWPAIILASLVFIIFHANAEHWPALFALSLCLGYAYEKSGSLFRSMFIHSMFNALSVFAALGQ